MLKFYVDYLMTRFASKKGQGMVEYALIISLIAIALIGALTPAKTAIADVFGKIVTQLTPPAGG